MSYLVEYYDRPDGSLPVEEFILLQSPKMRAKIFRNLLLLEEFGPDLRYPLSKCLDDGILELRTQVGNDISRVLYFFVIGNKIVLTNGFVKKTQKTPYAEIVLAKKCRHEYLSRRE